ncbi:MAG: cysteine desulfurase [Bacteroidales bacterium]|nr:cysteine desulfurase [Bacteroidales bacterium]
MFPILDTQIYGHRLVYLDNAATTQKPQQVIDTLTNYYLTLNSNIHRGAHRLAAEATERYEAVRRQVQSFINARSHREIVFTRGTTESINLVASSLGKLWNDQQLTHSHIHTFTHSPEVIVSGMEHHSNIVPWQLAGATLRVIPFSDEGVLDLDAYRALFNGNTRLVACTHVSNTLGTVNPVEEITRIAHEHGVPVLIDGAQAVAHMAVDVQAIGCDFYCFSGHKMYAPMGVGVMYGREEILDTLPPYQGGGEMIKDVTFERTTYNELPFRFEAGTPSVGDVLGLGSAIDFMLNYSCSPKLGELSAQPTEECVRTGLPAIQAHEESLMRYALEKLSTVPGIRFIGTAPRKAGVISFLLGDAHPYDVGTLLDKLGIAVRTGHHCTQPIMDRYGIPGTVRASFACYTTQADIDALHAALLRIAPMLQ